MSSHNETVTSSTTSERFIGRVKWFNNKAGYGFITVTDGQRSGSDVFVHHSAVQVESQQYKYLVQGEYVEFSLSDTPSGNHEFQAANVAGIKGGKLMCETRHELKISRSSYKEASSSHEVVEPVESVPRRQPRQKQAPVSQESQADGDKKEWTLVKKDAPVPAVRGRGRPPRSAAKVAPPS